MRICGQNPRTNADATFQDPVSEQQRPVHLISSHYDVTKVVILSIEYRYRSLSSIEVSSIDVIAGIVLTLTYSNPPSHLFNNFNTKGNYFHSYCKSCRA